MKRLVLNKKGMILYAVILCMAVLLAAADSESIGIFIITKAIALILAVILAILGRFIPEKYLKDGEQK